MDIVQELHERVGGDDGKLDILAEAAECGYYIAATTDAKLRPRNSVFLNMLAESKGGLILGNIKDQSIFSSIGLREENRNPDIGYINIRGKNQKVKLIQNT